MNNASSSFHLDNSGARHLAELRAEALIFDSEVDPVAHEIEFLFDVLDQKNRELSYLNSLLAGKRDK